MSDAVIIKTRKFKRNPLLARKQVCSQQQRVERSVENIACFDPGAMDQDWGMG